MIGASTTPVLAFGIDAGDSARRESWIADGSVLPRAALVRTDVCARTGGDELSMAYGAWIAPMCGVSRGQHGGTMRGAATAIDAVAVAPRLKQLAKGTA
ncbi:hypothetical protein [Gemmatimonas sp.]|uniref:hypothetical protein n=1 Tax=Gemmatimonas sp. TaxID=1962908 RepID=UPI003982E767